MSSVSLRTEFDSLQILRALAALAVVIFHLFQSLEDDFKLFSYNAFSVGAHGVDVFFVISGFIICHAHERDHSSLRFALKRIFRIVPLYYFLTLSLFVLAWIAPHHLNSTSADPVALVKSLLFIPYMRDNGMVQPLLFLGWTLNYEMFFYGLFAINLMLSKHAPIFCSIQVLALTEIGRLVQYENVVLDFYTDSVMLSFVWGCGAYLLFRHAPTIVIKLKPLGPLAASIMLVQNWWPLPLPPEFAFGLPAAFLLLSVLHMGPASSASARILKTIGDASYPLYLSHPYVVQSFVKIVIPLFGVSLATITIFSVVALLGSIAASVVLFFTLEKPINSWLRKKFRII